jgi:predicted HD phosphohydrolase
MTERTKHDPFPFGERKPRKARELPPEERVAREAEMERRILRDVYEKADARGIDRRRFLASTSGYIATIAVAQRLAACGAEAPERTTSGDPAAFGTGDGTLPGTMPGAGGMLPGATPGGAVGGGSTGIAGGAAPPAGGEPGVIAACPDPATLFNPADHDPPKAADFGVPGVAEPIRATFTRMDMSNPLDWLNVGTNTANRQVAVGQTLIQILNLMQGYHMGFGVDLLTHSLQAATRAKQANASDDMVLGALLHDIGMVLTPASHAEVGAAIIKSYVPADVYEIVKTHEMFVGRHTHAFLGRDPALHMMWSSKPWFEQAMTFADEWDGAAYDPSFPASPLAEFMPLVTEKTKSSNWYESQVCG